jgi:hypothetical protein
VIFKLFELIIHTSLVVLITSAAVAWFVQLVYLVMLWLQGNALIRTVAESMLIMKLLQFQLPGVRAIANV